MRKIEEMYRVSGGKTDNLLCKDCSNFLSGIVGDNKRVFKCKLYGITNSEASDWRKSYQACKWFNQDRPERNIIRLHAHEKKPEKPMEGQIELDLELLR